MVNIHFCDVMQHTISWEFPMRIITIMASTTGQPYLFLTSTADICKVLISDSSDSSESMKSINVSGSWEYLSGGLGFPLSIQKICSLQRQDISGFIQLIEIFELNGVLRRRQRLVSIPNEHLVLILTCEC